MRAREATELGQLIVAHLASGRRAEAHALLSPILAQRTRFPLLERLGRPIGAMAMSEANAFLDEIAAGRTEGGWVVIGSALREQLDRDPGAAFARCRQHIIAADVWYGADILGERVPGPALVGDFDTALDLLAPWQEDANRWVRRSIGVAVHFWAKRSRGAAELGPQAGALLNFLAPMFGEQEMDAVKGIGWGLKTLGKHYPDLIADWLVEQVLTRQRPHRALMLRKAMTYLPEAQRAQLGQASRHK